MSITRPAGFSAAGGHAGIKADGIPDLTLLVADRAVPTAAVFTSNGAPAAPVVVSRGHLSDGTARAVVVNSGCANAATGEAGFIDVIPFTLIAGLFLSNFPEALSSSANMLSQGWGKLHIFLMWFSLMVIAAAGAGLGYLLAGQLDHTWLALFEGLAAGAMLTMIAAAMSVGRVFGAGGW